MLCLCFCYLHCYCTTVVKNSCEPGSDCLWLTTDVSLPWKIQINCSTHGSWRKKKLVLVDCREPLSFLRINCSIFYGASIAHIDLCFLLLFTFVFKLCWIPNRLLLQVGCQHCRRRRSSRWRFFKYPSSHYPPSDFFSFFSCQRAKK